MVFSLILRPTGCSSVTRILPHLSRPGLPVRTIVVETSIRSLGVPVKGPHSRAARWLTEALAQVLGDLADGDALLRARVAVAHGDGSLSQGVAVDGEAVGAPRLVHAGVALADRLLGV